MPTLMEMEILRDTCVEAMAALSRITLTQSVRDAASRLYDLHQELLFADEKEIDTQKHLVSFLNTEIHNSFLAARQVDTVLLLFSERLNRSILKRL